ncbi:RING-box protein 2-like isoform X1 [Pollicipes pollicipes]|uniref:RING-box protein 2-like isoform X1 n=2 Tax=Pollicipes pollicipes TaxID=41117 RepID=UPI0018851606|nr:RING-box protein 2-like isoform X1 [Pollicipes pollicipes]
MKVMETSINNNNLEATPADPMEVDTAVKPEKMFALKKWNAVAMWRWDVECDTCAICRAQVMDACYRCQSEASGSKQDDCVVIWGECNHSFHNCCMSQWLQKNNRCPLCQRDWSFQRIGK